MPKLIRTIVVFAFFLLMASPVSAYTGIYGIFPVIPGGPSSTNVTRFSLDTTSGTQIIQTSLHYLYSITIETSEPVTSPILIKEYPTGSGTAFDIIVPKKVQDTLTLATLTIWAPDVENLIVEHDHNGAPLQYESATKVQPIITDENGNILWQFSVSSFSSFTPFESISKAIAPRSRWPRSVWYSIIPLITISLLAPFHLRQRL